MNFSPYNKKESVLVFTDKKKERHRPNIASLLLGQVTKLGLNPLSNCIFHLSQKCSQYRIFCSASRNNLLHVFSPSPKGIYLVRLFGPLMKVTSHKIIKTSCPVFKTLSLSVVLWNIFLLARGNAVQFMTC